MKKLVALDDARFATGRAGRTLRYCDFAAGRPSVHQIAVATGHAATAATHIHKSLPENFKGVDTAVDPAAA